MKNIDFKQIKSIKTPETWIENAMNIPQKNKKVIPFYLKSYFIASVASLVLCCTICISLFFGISNNAMVPIAHNTTQCTKETTDNIQQTETTTTIPEFTDNTTIDISILTVSTKPIQTQLSTTNIKIEPTEEPPSSVAPTVATETTKPNENTEQTIQTEPTEEITIPIATESPTALPVEPNVTEPITTVPEIVNPTVPGALPPIETEVTIYFTNVESRGFSQTNDIYCHIETFSGESDTGKFTESERVYWDNYNGYAFYQTKLKIFTQYYITFYDEYGNSYTADIFYYGGTIYI